MLLKKIVSRDTLALAIVMTAAAGCACHTPQPSPASQHTGAAEEERVPVPTPHIMDTGHSHEQTLTHILAQSQEDYSRQNAEGPDGAHDAGASKRLPNPEGEVPLLTNFYSTQERYPGYLLCEFDVCVVPYRSAEEDAYFIAALKQVRRAGRKSFPPVKWVAVMIVNRGEPSGESSPELYYKSAAVFEAASVFSRWSRLSHLVSEAPRDRHPFRIDVSKSSPGEQQRWLVVERRGAASKE